MISLTAAGCGEKIQEGMAESHIEQEIDIRSTAANRLEAVRESGTLIIGISADYAPFAFSYEKEGETILDGSDLELGNYLAECLGVDAEFRNMKFEECLKAIETGSVDLILTGMLPKAERRSMMDFTDVYYQPGEQQILVEKSRKTRLSKAEDFEGLTFAAQYGTLQAQLVIEQMPESYLELVDAVTDGVLMLQSGKADAMAVDEETAKELLKEYDTLALADLAFDYTSEGIVGGVPKGEQELLSEVNAAIEQVKNQGLYLGWLDMSNQLAASLQNKTGQEMR